MSNTLTPLQTNRGLIYPTKRIQSAIHAVEETRHLEDKDMNICMIVGDPGVGKTATAMYLNAYYANSHYVVSREGETKLSLMRRIAKSLGYQSDKSSFNDTYDWVLENQNKPLIILIDEADFLSTRSLNVIKGLADETKHTFVLLGTRGFKATLTAQKNNLAMERLKSRIAEKETEYGQGLTPKELAECLIKPCFNLESVDAALVRRIHEVVKGNWRKAKDAMVACRTFMQRHPKQYPEFSDQLVKEAIGV